MKKIICICMVIVINTFYLIAANNSYIELGNISWLRDYNKALEKAKKDNKPVLILFQEVPGCSTCQNYGLRVLSHPLLVDAAENLFIPLVIFNNRQGTDARILNLFHEPAWNNPVVRIVDSNGKEIIKRLANDYTASGFSGAMIKALTVYGKKIPFYLKLLHTELLAQDSTEEAVFSMYCFWQGEVDIGSLDGVIKTRAGYIEGREAVEVEFDNRVISFKRLLKQARNARCADRIYPSNPDQEKTVNTFSIPSGKEDPGQFRQDIGNTKYYLSHTSYKYIPMTELQQIYVNRVLSKRQDPNGILSPRQKQILKYIKSHPKNKWKNQIGLDDIRTAWDNVWSQVIR